MPPLRRKQKPKPKPKPKPEQPTTSDGPESALAPYSLAGASLDSLLETMKLIRLDSLPADEFLPLPERKEKAQQDIERGYDSAQRLKKLFPDLTLDAPALDLSEFEVWPDWKKRHLADLKPPLNSKSPASGQREFDHLYSDEGVGDWSICAAFRKAIGIRSMFANSEDGGDEWVDTQRALMSVSLRVDGYGPSYAIFQQRLVIEVVDVRLLPVEPRKPGSDGKKAATVPVVVVLFLMSTAPASLAERKAREPLVRYLKCLDKTVIGVGYPTSPSTTLQMASLLIHNSSLLSPEYVSAMKKDLPHDLKAAFGVSFFVPLHSVEFKVSSKIATDGAINSRARCALPSCNEAGVSLACSSCKSVLYCNTKHATEYWPIHKLSCLRAKYPALFVKRAAERGRILVPLITKLGADLVTTVNYQTGVETSFDASIVPRNAHGSAFFLVKVQRSNTEDVTAFGAPVQIYDRDRTILTSYGLRHPGSNAPIDAPADIAGYKKLDDCILACARWDGAKAYFKAYRVGDQLEIDLDDLPSQEQTW